MKIAKKTLALALASIMTVSNIAIASATEMDTKAKLNKLMDLEVVFGDNTDPYSLNFAKDMERYRSIALMLRLTEEGSGAMDSYHYQGQATFADQGEFSTYVKRVMAYSKNNDIGIDGYKDGTLRPLTTLTDQAYAKMMLESLGYEAGSDYEWSTVAAKAAEVGIVGSADEITNEVIPFGEVVEMTYDTLAAEVKGKSITLGEKISKPVFNSKLEVTNVEALNLKQVKVTFPTAVDEKSATDMDNYDLDAKNASLTWAKAELVDDNAVVITFAEGEEAKQQDTVKLTVEDVIDTKGEVLAKTEVEVSFFDQTVSTVKGVEVIGNKTLKVTFSEPMKTVEKGNFIVRDGSKTLYLDKVEAVNDERTEFYITLFNDLKEGKIDLTVNYPEDYAGFNTFRGFGAIAVDKDALVELNVNGLTAPDMAKFKATLYNPGAAEQTIKLSFGERMAERGAYSVADENKYIIGGHHFSEIKDATIDVVDGGKAIEMTIPNAAEEGKDIDGSMEIQVARVADAAGNKTAALSGILEIDVAGTVAIKKAKAIAKDTIVLEFDDKLNDVEPTEFKFELGDAAVAISSVNVGETEEGNTIIVFNTSNDLATDADSLDLTVDSGVSDRSNNKYNEMVEVVTNKAVTDKIIPEIVIENDAQKITVDKANGTLTIEFSEALSTLHQTLIATEFAVIFNDNQDLVGGVDYVTTVEGRNLKIALKDGDATAKVLETGDDIRLVSNLVINYLRDTSANAAKHFSFLYEVQ